MDKLTIKSLYRKTEEYSGKEVVISGWVRTVRASKAFGFVEINDGSFFKNLQGRVMRPATGHSNFPFSCRIELASPC